LYKANVKGLLKVGEKGISQLFKSLQKYEGM
jgi:hypothetical protein